MWRNIFLESCLLSALIFGGFYLNSIQLKSDLPPKAAPTESTQVAWEHISGQVSNANEEKETFHLSGSEETPTAKANQLFN